MAEPLVSGGELQEKSSAQKHCFFDSRLTTQVVNEEFLMSNNMIIVLISGSTEVASVQVLAD